MNHDTPQQPPSSPNHPGSAPTPEHDAVDIHDLPHVGSLGALLIALGAVAVFAGIFVIGWLPHQKRQASLEAETQRVRDFVPVVEVAKPQRQAAVTQFTLPGNVRAQKESPLYSRTNGYLKKLYVDIGERVTAGQLLAEIDSPEVDAQLARTRATLAQSKADALKSEADRDLAQSTLDRYEAFAKQGGVTKQQLDEKRALLDQSKAVVASTQATIQVSQAEVDRLTKLQEFEKITAPFAGIITARNYDLGTLLSGDNTDPGKDMFRLAQTDPLRVFVDVPQAYVAMIANNQPAFLEVSNFPGRSFPGQVLRSTGEIDTATRTLRFLVLVPNPDGLLFPGMYANVRFQIHDATPPLTVPSSALVFAPDGPSVAVADDGVVHFKQIKIGRDYGPRVEALSGVGPDDEIVTNPGEQLVEGVTVRAVTANDQKPAEKPVKKPDDQPAAAAKEQ